MLVAVRLWQNDATSVSAVFDVTAPSFTDTPTTGGTYYLAVSAGGTGVWQDKTGDFQISLVDQGASGPERLHVRMRDNKAVGESDGTVTFTLSPTNASGA